MSNQTETCGWAKCQGCAAVRAFEEKWAAGEIKPKPPITSAWWESAEAEQLYQRGVNLAPCQHP